MTFGGLAIRAPSWPTWGLVPGEDSSGDRHRPSVGRGLAERRQGQPARVVVVAVARELAGLSRRPSKRRPRSAGVPAWAHE